MKTFKKILYKEKYDEFINKYGLDKGSDKYYGFIRSQSLESCVLKYGEEEGRKKYNEYKEIQKKSGVSLKKMIDKYGEEKGREKYKNWKLNTRQDLDGFIRRYGKEEGEKRYEIFKNKSIKSFENIDQSKIPRPRRLEYWINKGYDEETAKEKLRDFQNNSSLDKYVQRYGKEKGEKMYIEHNKFKSTNVENMIRIYGEEEGKKRYNKWLMMNKYVKTLDYYIEKYGKKEGVKIYNDIQRKKIENNNYQYSMIGLEFCEKLSKKIEKYFKKVYFGDNEYRFHIGYSGMTYLYTDFYIKDINLIIEFYGDYWHCNPDYYELNEKTKEIYNKDNNRINSIKEKYNSDVIIVWENDYKLDKNKTINNLVKQIKNKMNKNE